MKASLRGCLGLALAGFGLFGCAGQAPSMAGFVAQGTYTSYALSGHYPQFNTESTDVGGSYRMDAPDVVSISTFFGDSFRYGLEIGMNGTPAAMAGYRAKSLAGYGWMGGNEFGWIGGLGALETVYHKGSWASDILSNLETLSIYESIGENQVSEIKNNTLTEQVGVESYPELDIGGVAEFPRGSVDLRLGEDPLERILRAYITLSMALEWTRL